MTHEIDDSTFNRIVKLLRAEAEGSYYYDRSESNMEAQIILGLLGPGQFKEK